MDDREDTQYSDLEWENRVLCSDESCIGTIGPDGRCKECGQRYEGELPLGLKDRDAVEAQADTPAEAVDDRERQGDSAAQEASAKETPAADDEWSRRTLCRDEGCIGVIGADGRCKECGMPYDQG